MRIFVTGGTGFVGVEVVNALAKRGCELLVLTRKNNQPEDRFTKDKKTRYLAGDLAQIEKIKADIASFKPEAAVHLAWEGLPDYSLEMCLKNVIHGINLFRTLADIGVKAVLSAGSCWEYAETDGPVTENATRNLSKTFSLTKDILRKAGEGIAESYGMEFYWARIFFVYGPGQRAEALVPSFVRALTKRAAPDINNPEAAHDFIFVADAAECIARIIELRPGTGVYNVGSGRLAQVAEVVSIIRSRIGPPPGGDAAVDYHAPERPKGFYADLSKVREKLEWAPEYGLEKGIEITIKRLMAQNENRIDT